MEGSLILLGFLVFSYIIDDFSCLEYCMTVSSPNFHRLCVCLMYTVWYINMPNVTSNFYKLYVKVEVYRNESNPM